MAHFGELRRAAPADARRDGRVAAVDRFFAKQKARRVADADAAHYYQAMFGSRVSSWSLQLSPRRRPRDGRAMAMGAAGETNVEALVRERYEGDAALVDFTTDDGTVTAASDWGRPAERKVVRRTLPESYETLFDALGKGNFIVCLEATAGAAKALAELRLERAIGVVIRPETEPARHYVLARLLRHFDVVLHYDRTQGVEPRERTTAWTGNEPPETYPTAL